MTRQRPLETRRQHIATVCALARLIVALSKTRRRPILYLTSPDHVPNFARSHTVVNCCVLVVAQTFLTCVPVVAQVFYFRTRHCLGTTLCRPTLPIVASYIPVVASPHPLSPDARPIVATHPTPLPYPSAPSL